MDFMKELITLVEKAKAKGIELEDIVNDLESMQETLQEEIEESQEKDE